MTGVFRRRCPARARVRARATVQRCVFLLSLGAILAGPGSGEAVGSTLAAVSFQNRSPTGEWDWLSLGLADMVSADVARSPEIDLVERQRIARILEELESGGLGFFDPETAAKVGKAARVDLVLFGSFLKDGERLEIEAAVADIDTGRLRKLERAVGDASDVFALADRIAFQIVENLNVEISAEERDAISRPPTSSIDAARKYYEGLALHDRGSYPASLAAFRTAAANDPGYLEARDRVARTYEEIDEPEHAAIEYAGLVRDLPEAKDRPRWLVTLARIQRNELNAADAALRSASRAVQCYPDWLDPFEVQERLIPEYEAYEAGDPGEKIRFRRYRRKRELQPYAQALGFLRASYLERGDFENALWASLSMDMYLYYAIYGGRRELLSDETRGIYARAVQANVSSRWTPPGSVVAGPGQFTIGTDSTGKERFDASPPPSPPGGDPLVVTPPGYEFESYHAVSRVPRESLPRRHGVRPFRGFLVDGEGYVLPWINLLGAYSSSTEGGLSIPEKTIGLQYVDYGGDFWKLTLNVVPAGTPRLSTSEKHLEAEIQARIRPFECWVTLRSEDRVYYDWCNQDGEVWERGLQPGTYSLEVSHEGLPPKKEAFVIEPREKARMAVSLASPWVTSVIDLPVARNISVIEAGRRSYCMVFQAEFEGSEDLFITRSPDLENWSAIERLPFCTQAPETDPSLVWDDEGWYRLAFRKEEPGRLARRWFACRSRDLVAWSDPALVFEDLAPERDSPTSRGEPKYVGGPDQDFWQTRRDLVTQRVRLIHQGQPREDEPSTYAYLEVALPREGSRVRLYVDGTNVYHSVEKRNGSWTMPEILTAFHDYRDFPPALVTGPEGYPCLLDSGRDGKVQLHRFEPERLPLTLGETQADTIDLAKVGDIATRNLFSRFGDELWFQNAFGKIDAYNLKRGTRVPVPGEKSVATSIGSPLERMGVLGKHVYMAAGKAGLLIYDSRNKSWEQHLNEESFPVEQVECVTVADDRVWLGTDKGIYTFDPGTSRFDFVGPPDYLAPVVTAILVTDDHVFTGNLLGSVWCLDRGSGEWTEYTTDMYLGPPDHPLMASSARFYWIKGVLWRHSSRGLEILEDGKWRVLLFGSPLSFLQSVYDGEYLWMAGGSGVYTIDIETETPIAANFTRVEADTNPNIHQGIFIDGDDVYLATWENWWKGSREEILKQREELVARGERRWRMSPAMRELHMPWLADAGDDGTEGE